MLHYFLCWMRDFIVNKRLLVFAIIFTIILWILKGANLFPENESWYIFVTGVLSAVNYTMYFFSIKREVFVKIIYGLAMIAIAILMILASLELLELIDLPSILIR